jgi:hypothetical protein
MLIFYHARMLAGQQMASQSLRKISERRAYAVRMGQYTIIVAFMVLGPD